jgi:hypothetical protein
MKDNNYSEPITIRKRVGSTTYEVNCYFNLAAKETVEEKLLRIIRNELTFGGNCGIMKTSQTVGLHTQKCVGRSSA